MKAENRDVSISLIRDIAMLMVIACHLCEQLSGACRARETVTLLCNWSRVLFALVLFTILHRQIKIGYVGEKVMAFSDKYSYPIYLAHMIYIKGPLGTLNLTACPALNLGVTIALAFASSVGLLYLCQGIRFVYAKGKARA